MSKLRAVQVQVDFERLRSVQPLIDYLRQDRPITADVRQWLIALLEKTGNYGLDFAVRPGRKLSDKEIKAQVAIYHRFNELAGAKIQSIFCDEIAKSLGTKKAFDSRSRARNDFDYDQKGPETVYFISGFRLVKGKKISREMAFKLVAQQFKRSIPGVKKIVRPIEAARRFNVPSGTPWILKGAGQSIQPSANRRVSSAGVIARRRRR